LKVGEKNHSGKKKLLLSTFVGEEHHGRGDLKRREVVGGTPTTVIGRLGGRRA
jgi:hypothetical protein